MPLAEARLRDPAHRDTDGTWWRRGRFAERVRRQWNAVPGGIVETHRGDLAALAGAIHTVVGGDVAHIEARLEEFSGIDAEGEAASADPLLRPGASE